MNTLFGGSESESQQTSQSGWALLPQELKDAFTKLATNASSYIGDAGTSAYTPTDITVGEQTAINNLYSGFTPDATTLQSDIDMQMNPYNSYVIDEINRQSQGDYSTLKQSLGTANQFGSNRAALGANDIDLSRTNQIGTFLQDQYNTALDNSLNTLTANRRADASGALTGGTYARDLALQQSSAPITALQQIATAMGILPTSGGSTGQMTSSSYDTNGVFSIF